MIIKEKMHINSGLLFQGRNLIGTVEAGEMEHRFFVPDRFMYEFVHERDDTIDQKDNTAPIKTGL